MVNRSLNADDDRSYLPILPLFLRISSEHVQQKQKERKQDLKCTLIILVIYILILCFFGFDNEMYNALKGPFHMNSNQFIQHIKYYNQKMKFFNRILFSFSEKYFQIELGENHIEKYEQHPFLYLIIEPILRRSLSPNNLYVKLASEEESHYHTRLSFNFRLFSIKTLKCIVRQMNISSTISKTWLEKSLFIKTIEEYYDKNSTLFNKNVLIKCGILIGYLYHPRNEFQFIGEYTLRYNFNLFDVAIDASCSYFSIPLILECILLAGILIQSLIYLVSYLFYRIRPMRININSNIKKQFKILGINSLYSLTDLLYDSILNNLNYRYHTFIIEENYLIIFNIDLNEYNPEKLRSFYNESPFIVIPISSIIEIRNLDFFIDDGNHRKLICFSTISDEIKVSKWLHDQLMWINSNYRNRYEETVRKEKEKERYARQFASLVAREEEIQHNKTANSPDRMMGIIKSASPRFIAQFCLTNHPIVQTNEINLLNNQCSICLNSFTVGEEYAQWPCPAQHYFHSDCMLDVLRESNKCPLCRFTVESTPSLFHHFFHRFFR